MDIWKDRVDAFIPTEWNAIKASEYKCVETRVRILVDCSLLLKARLEIAKVARLIFISLGGGSYRTLIHIQVKNVSAVSVIAIGTVQDESGKCL